jgi:nucleotide-binding universal stress UspA family protein
MTGASPVAEAAAEPAFRTLVVGFDGSPAAVRAGRLAVALGWRTGARLWFVYAHEEPSQLVGPQTEEASSSPIRAVTRSMEALVDEARAAGVPAEAVMRPGAASEVLVAFAREVEGSGIVVGSRGLGAAARLMLGSVSSRLVVTSPVPVTVVP